jgi:hypothetical protein
MKLDEEQAKKLECLISTGGTIVGYLNSQVINKKISGQLYIQQIKKFTDAYNEFVACVH